MALRVCATAAACVVVLAACSSTQLQSSITGESGHKVELFGDDPELTLELISEDQSFVPEDSILLPLTSEMSGDAFHIEANRAFQGTAVVTAPIAQRPEVFEADPFLAYYDETEADWIPVPSVYSAHDATVAAESPHLSTWGAFVWSADAVIEAMVDESFTFIPGQSPACRTPADSNFSDLKAIWEPTGRNDANLDVCLMETGATDEIVAKFTNQYPFAIIVGGLPSGSTLGEPYGGWYPQDLADQLAEKFAVALGSTATPVPPGATIDLRLPVLSGRGTLELDVWIDATSVAFDLMYAGGQLLLKSGGEAGEVVEGALGVYDCVHSVFTSEIEDQNLIRLASTIVGCFEEFVPKNLFIDHAVFIQDYFRSLSTSWDVGWRMLTTGGSARLGTFSVSWIREAIGGRLPQSEPLETTTTADNDRTPASTGTTPTDSTSAPITNRRPRAALWVCSGSRCGENGATLTTTQSDVLSFEALADNGSPGLAPSPSFDPDGDPLGFEWLINGELVSRDPSFRFEASALDPGPNSVLLRVGDDNGAVSEAGATVILPVEICSETLEPPLGPLGSYTVDGRDAEPGVIARAEIVVDESGDNLNWPMTIDLYDSGGMSLHSVHGLGRSTLFGVDQPLARGAIVDATGDLRPDAVVCLGGTFNGGFDVQILVISDHLGRWQTVLDEAAVNGVAVIATPMVTITETRFTMLGACTDIAERDYEFADAGFRFVSERTSNDWTIPECEPSQ